ncbi:hypothetical protein EV426DRAFT_311186 [Tirmania nivea]|nr:hypothetical protein EV426DRAFT_311186 [Tirmania nivea]
MWKKKDLTKIDKDHCCQAAFGTSPTQLQYSEGGSSVKVNEPIGVRVHRQWSGYAKNIMRSLRKHFEALLLMLFDNEEFKRLVNAMFLQIKAFEHTEWIGLDKPCITPIEIRDRFIKANVKLVSDVWYPIMDVAPPDFLTQNGIWGQRFIDATATVLAWMLTHFFRVKGAKEKMRFEPPGLGQCPVGAGLVTASICKADIAIPMPIDFPPVNKPNDWNSRKCPSSPYGELKYVKIIRDTAESVLEDEIDRELHMMALKGPTDHRQRKLLTERFLVESKTMFQDTMQRESMLGSVDGTGSLFHLRRLWGFRSMDRFAKKGSLFSRDVSQYNAAAFGSGVGFGL